VFFTGDVTDCQKAHWRNTYAKMRIKFIALSDAPPITRLVYGSSWFCERSWRVFEYLRQARCSVVHFQDWQANGFWSIKAKRVGLAFEQTTLTVMTHSCTKWINEGMQQFSATPFETAKLVWAETYCMEHCDLLLSPSRHMLQWIEKNQIHMPPRTLLTPYAWTDGAATAPRVSAVVNSDHLIFFGRLETRKGLHIFGEALRCLQREGAALPRAISFLGKHASVQGQPSTAYLEALHRDLPTV
jgi:glycosyltransferase involved in cell wall biosynthesis